MSAGTSGPPTATPGQWEQFEGIRMTYVSRINATIDAIAWDLAGAARTLL